jgi:hypothetical protein
VPQAKNTPKRPATKPRKRKPPRALRERSEDLLAWMHKDLRRALRYVALAWLQSAKYDGRSDDAPMAEVLGALAEASTAELTARNGPRAWARKQRPKGRSEIRPSDGRKMPRPVLPPRGFVDLPRSKADAGRHLVRWIEWWLAEHGVDLAAPLPRDGRREVLVADVPPDEVSFVKWVVGLVVATDAPAAGWGRPPSTDPDEIDRRVTAQLRRAIKRWDCTPVSIAIAVLVGWGLPRAKAKDAVRHVERA